MARRGPAPTIPPPPSAHTVPLPPPSSNERLPTGAPQPGVGLSSVTLLLDRLALADESGFLVAWLEALRASRGKLEPPLSVRLLRAYRDSGRLDRARELAASLPAAPAAWGAVDVARLCVERAVLATIDGRAEQAENELRSAARALAAAPSGTGQREQLDRNVVLAQLELKRNRVEAAQAALKLAEHVSERLEDGAWRVPVEMTLGHLAMRLGEPASAARHYLSALDRSPARGSAAMAAHGNAALALGAIGRTDEAREHATASIRIAAESRAGWRHADAFDVLAIVEIAADRADKAIAAIDGAMSVLGDTEQPTLRYQLAEHRAWALAMQGRGQAAKQALSRAEKLRSELGAVDAIDEQDLVATRARTLEACGQYAEAVAAGSPHLTHLPDAFVTGNLNLVVGRAALALGDEALARLCAERAALSGEAHGWVFPERALSAPLYRVALASGDSRVVRYAEQSLAAALDDEPLPSRRGESHVDLVYLTTKEGVAPVARADLGDLVGSFDIVVDTLAHELHAFGKTISLERRRALEPLLVQLLRRAKEGLSAEEILRAAGGPGPESADAEHRVRVLVSRVRDLLGDARAVERMREAGERGKTRYRLAAGHSFGLVEPRTG